MTGSTNNRSTLPTRQHIVDVCGPREDTNVLKYEVDGAPPLFIKFGFDIMGEAETQKYLYEQSVRNSNAPRLPAVYDSFEVGPIGFRQGFIVMEYIEAPTVEYWLEKKSEMAELLCDKVAEAVRWVLDCPVAPEPRFGPVGCGPARHMAFADRIAPLEFDCTDAVQRYFTKVGLKPHHTRELLLTVHGDAIRLLVDFLNRRRSPRPSTSPMKKSASTTVTSDHPTSTMTQRRRKLRSSTSKMLVWVPSHLQAFALHMEHYVDREFRHAIVTRIDYQRTESIDGMELAFSYLQMCSDATLGMLYSPPCG